MVKINVPDDQEAVEFFDPNHIAMKMRVRALQSTRATMHREPMVGCENSEGFLIIHGESKTCEVCSPTVTAKP